MTSKKIVRKEVLGIPAPKRASDAQYHDRLCPFTGSLPVKKETIQGVVVKRDTTRSATIEWARSRHVPKYERYEVKKSRLRVHNPPCLNAQIGQTVLVARTRPLSKTKNHVVIKVFDQEELKTQKETKKKAQKASGDKQ